MTLDEDFIEVDEEITYTITCLKCRVRFKAKDLDTVAKLVARHRRVVHNDSGQRG